MAWGWQDRDRPLLTAAEEEKVKAAVAAAEQATAGELVPWIVGEADPHPEGPWKGATAGALLAAVAGWAAHFASGGWGGMLAWTVLPALAGAVAGYALGGLPPLRRWLVGDEILDHRVRAAAEAAFLRAQVFATRERTGVLIFVAVAEHRVVVLGDAGINARVDPAEWQAVADDIVAAIRRRDTAAGLCAGIADVGRLLAERGVARASGDVNELPDEPRQGEPRR